MLSVGSVSSVLMAPDILNTEEVDVRAPDDPVMCGRLKNSETLCNLESLFVHLSEVQSSKLRNVIREYPVLFGDGVLGQIHAGQSHCSSIII